jgi:uncharacterized cupredoxin-like copper-binding protein
VKRIVALAVAVLCGGGVVYAGYAFDDPANATVERDVLGPGRVRVEIGIDYSAYSTETIKVFEGTLVEFVVRNDDPINHELVVGPPEVHARHRVGKERAHPPIPGELSLGPAERGLTVYRFDRAGIVEFACHLQGHYEYGMRGTIEVIPSPVTQRRL